MGKGRVVRLLRWVLAGLAVILAFAALSAPVAARLSLPFEETTSAIAQHHSTFVCLSLSVKSEPLKFHAKKGVIGVLAFDVDHDGYTDVVTLRRNSRVRVWLNNGHGGFVRRTENGARVSSGSRIRGGDPSQKGACCGPVYNDDGLSALPVAPVFGAGLLPSRTNRPSAENRLPFDPFLKRHTSRGPPEFIA